MTLDMTYVYTLALPLLLLLSFGLLLLFSALAARPKAGTTEWIHRAAFPAPFDSASVALARGSDWLLALVAFAAGALLQLIPLYLTTPLSAIGLSELAPSITVGLAAACGWFAGCQLTGNRLCALFAAIFGFCLYSFSGSQEFFGLWAFFFLFAALSRIWFLPVAGLFIGAGTFWDASSLGLLLPALALAVLLTISRRRFRPLFLWLLTAFLAVAVSMGLLYLRQGVIACPLPGWKISAAPLYYALALLMFFWLMVRIRQESRFADILLLALFLTGLAVSLLGCNLLFFLPVLSLIEAGRLAKERENTATRIMMYIVLALFFVTAVGNIFSRLGFFPSVLSKVWIHIIRYIK